ncbi:uncharacterized protein LOC108201810 isoform X2 [Daucus carota subsp. sativus]|uniref:uncharacterized protein LOC108201810 isoform X2 n=1 Tax=Daucus carota subsp. sativus TaxID=79200 RepID=UPI003083CA01
MSNPGFESNNNSFGGNYIQAHTSCFRQDSNPPFPINWARVILSDQEVLDSRRVSCSVVEPDYCWIDDNRVVQVNVQSERDCRICQLSVEMDAAHQENGIAIELGCSCKDDLAAAHKHCAEAWFKIKGNKLYLLYWLWLW